MFIGSLVGAFFADRFVRYRHFTMAATLILGAVTIGVVPFCCTVSALSTTFFFSGCAHGAMTASELVTDGNFESESIPFFIQLTL